MKSIRAIVDLSLHRKVLLLLLCCDFCLFVCLSTQRLQAPALPESLESAYNIVGLPQTNRSKGKVL